MLNVFFVVVAIPSAILRNPCKRLITSWAQRRTGLFRRLLLRLFIFEYFFPIALFLRFLWINVFLVVVAIPSAILRNPSKRLIACWTQRLARLFFGFCLLRFLCLFFL